MFQTVCVSCVRLRFVCTKLIVSTLVTFAVLVLYIGKAVDSHLKGKFARRDRLKKMFQTACVSCVRLRFVCTKLIVPTLVTFAVLVSCIGKAVDGYSQT